MEKLKPCPFCGKEIDTDKDMYIPERDRTIVESNDIHVNGSEELIKNFKKNMVFQMPEDSEVEA